MARVIHHNYIRNTALPYISNVSPTVTEPYWADGTNMIGTIRGNIETRPGFSLFTSDTFATTNRTVHRIFTWSQWDGSYYVMLSVQDSATVKVYKLKVGTDATFQHLSAANSTATLPFDFAVANNQVFFGNGTNMWKYDGSTVTQWGISKPAAAPTSTPAGGGTLSPATGYQWKYAFGTSTHVGDISDASASSGAGVNQQYTITGSTTSDTQVTKVYIFRTVDGGAVYFHHPSSPITYSVGWSLVDTAADTSLLSAVAPVSGVNAPPTASRGTTYFANRLWTFKNDTVYYSNFEEQGSFGEVEQSFTSTNKYRFSGTVTALAVVQQSLMIFTTTGIYRILGDSLTTFTRAPFLKRMGVSGPHNVAVDANMMAWLDISGTIWVTDAASSQTVDTNATKEWSIPIRPDIAAINQSTSSISFHRTTDHNWLIVQDAQLGLLFVYDMDLGQWNVPWTLGDPNGVQFIGHAIHSGETASGTTRLFIPFRSVTSGDTQVCYLNNAIVRDYNAVGSGITDGYAFPLTLTSGNMDIVPPQANGVPRDGMSPWGVIQYIGVETTAVLLSDIAYLIDANPFTGTHTSIVANVASPAFRTDGNGLAERWYYLRDSPGRRASIKLTWSSAVTSKQYLYTLEVAGEIGSPPGEF